MIPRQAGRAGLQAEIAAQGVAEERIGCEIAVCAIHPLKRSYPVTALIAVDIAADDGGELPIDPEGIHGIGPAAEGQDAL
jgi:hypothetical protein